MEQKISQARCSASKRVITPSTESIEQENYKACTGIIHKKLYELVYYEWSYNVNINRFTMYLHVCTDNIPIN